MKDQCSIIVIGRNEAKTLGDIFAGFKELNTRLAGDVQLIYVDSDSEDASVAIAQAFRQENPECDVHIVRIQGQLNSAIARNVGIRFLNPQTEFVFFLDGDIVFDVDFVIEAIDVLQREPGIGSVCGPIMNSFDGTTANLLARRDATIGKSQILRWHGGNFLTRKVVLDQIGLFDECLMRHQDIDYALRTRKKGHVLWLLDRRMGIHYTTSYMNQGRLWCDLKRGNFLCSGLLVRKHLFSCQSLDALRAVSGIAYRCTVVCCAVAGIFYTPLAILAALGVLAILLRTTTAKQESILARALSFAGGIQFLIGLISFRRRQAFDIQVV